MIRVKLCGFTDREDVDAAIGLGVDAIGWNLARGPRRITVDHAADLSRRLPPFIGSIGLFVDAEEATIIEALDRCRLNGVQLHGDEPPELAERLRTRVPVIKAFRIREAADLDRAAAYPCDALLLDAFVPGVHGGSGAQWDLGLLADRTFSVPVILAGGLTPTTVAEALRVYRPWAVDAASGVESSPGRKDTLAMAAFMAAVRGDLPRR